MLQIPLSSLVLSVGNIIFYLSVFRVIFNPIYFIAISSFDYWQYFYPAATVQLNLLYSHIYNHFSLAMIEACWTCVVTYPFYFIFLGNELSLNGNKISGVVPLKFAWIPWVNLCIKLLEWISDLSALFCCSSVLLQCHDLHSLSFLFVFFFLSTSIFHKSCDPCLELCSLMKFDHPHSQQTFVLDVHPFNPRIAMSAGYDGKTIIWDVSFLPDFFYSYHNLPGWTSVFLYPDLGREACTDIWNWAFQVSWWEVLTVSVTVEFLHSIILLFFSNLLSSTVIYSSHYLGILSLRRNIFVDFVVQSHCVPQISLLNTVIL